MSSHLQRETQVCARVRRALGAAPRGGEPGTRSVAPNALSPPKGAGLLKGWLREGWRRKRTRRAEDTRVPTRTGSREGPAEGGPRQKVQRKDDVTGQIWDHVSITVSDDNKGL